MAITKFLTGALLVLFVLAAAPVAQAQNTGDRTTTTRPHKGADPANKAERQVKRKQQREMQRQQQGSAPSRPPSN